MRPNRSPRFSLLLLVALAACTSTVYVHDEDAEALRPCDPSFVTSPESSSGESSSSESSSEESSSSTGEPPIVCPVISSGDVTFQLPISGVTRYVRFTNVAAANGQGPIALFWHGTYESIPSVQTYNPVTDLQSMVVAEHGVLALPYPDMMAQADGEPFPWWVVCGASGTSCDRIDDFELSAAVYTCAVEQGLVSDDRIVMAGMSAGGIQASYELAQESRLAGAVVWSGGVDPLDRPTDPVGTPSVFVLHGGVTDVYPQGCNPAVPPCHSFVAPNEDLAIDVDATLTCDHGTGHNAFGGNIGAEFLARAQLGLVHPWDAFAPNVGAGGWQQFPNMSNGAMWVLRNDCDRF